MSCPDNLLTGYRKGALSSEEQGRLDAHLAGCPTCRLTLRVGLDFDEVLQTAVGDDLIAARFARKLGAKLTKERAPERAFLVRYAWVAVAMLAVVASAGLAAASLGAWPFASEKSKSAEAIESHARPKRAAPAPTPEPTAAPEPQPAAEPVSEVPVEEASAPVQRTASAAELFAQANARRHAGEPGRARALYRELQRRYPHSAEVEVSYVSLGRVQLELGETRAALEQFERYLARQPRGPLAEEALFAKATALERMKRAAAERKTWEALLASFPNTLYGERARSRLVVLRADAPTGSGPAP